MSNSLPPTLSRAAIKATIGRRQQQQDTARQTAVRLDDGREALLIIVADGMGGAVGGQIASSRAVDAFAAYAAASDAPTAERLRGALAAANGALATAVSADPRLSGMGSTLIGAVLDGPRLDWISVGDSLLLSVEGGQVQRLNADHSMGGVLDRQVERGEITAAQAAASDQRHLLRSALTGDPIPLIDTGSAVLGETARLVVASDGVLTMSFNRLAEIISSAQTLDAAADHVTEAIDALGVEDQDNMTIAVAASGESASAGGYGGGGANGAVRKSVTPERNAQKFGQQAVQQPSGKRGLAIAMLVLGVLVMVGAGIAAWIMRPQVGPSGGGGLGAGPTSAASVPASPVVEQYQYKNTLGGGVSGAAAKHEGASGPAHDNPPEKAPSKPEAEPTPKPHADSGKSDPTPKPAADHSSVVPKADGPDKPAPNEKAPAPAASSAKSAESKTNE